MTHAHHRRLLQTGPQGYALVNLSRRTALLAKTPVDANKIDSHRLARKHQLRRVASAGLRLQRHRRPPKRRQQHQ